jgi:hypothetical protein
MRQPKGENKMSRRPTLVWASTLHSELSEDFICSGDSKVFGVDTPVTILRECYDRRLVGASDERGKVWFGWVFTDAITRPEITLHANTKKQIEEMKALAATMTMDELKNSYISQFFSFGHRISEDAARDFRYNVFAYTA